MAWHYIMFLLQPMTSTHSDTASLNPMKKTRDGDSGRARNAWLQIRETYRYYLNELPFLTVNSVVTLWSQYLPRSGVARVTPGFVAPCRTPLRITHLNRTLTHLVSSCVSWFLLWNTKQQLPEQQFHKWRHVELIRLHISRGIALFVGLYAHGVVPLLFTSFTSFETVHTHIAQSRTLQKQ